MFPHQKLDWLLGRLEADAREKTDDPAVRLEYARALISKGLFHGGGEQYCSQALRQVQRILKEDALNGEALVLAGLALIGMNRPDGARSYLDEAFKRVPERPDLHLALGVLYHAEGDRHRAIGHLEQACRLAPESWEANFHLGRTLFERARELGHPRRLLERAQYHLVQALKGGINRDLGAIAERDLGTTCLLTGRYVEAEKLFNRLRDHPRMKTRARYHLGCVAYGLGKYKNAIHHLRSYVGDNPNDASAWATMAQAYLQLGELARAREACNKALLLDPDNLEARYTLGCTVLEEGDPQEALRFFRVNLRAAPDHLPSYVELVRTRRRGGDMRWLAQALHTEVGDHDRLPAASEAGDPRVATRERIGVLLDELRAIGPSSVGTILGAVQRTHTEAIRFQLWEAAVGLAAGQAADDVALKLRDPGRHFSADLGRQALTTALLLPEPVLTRGLAVGEEDLKREAVNRYGPAIDVGRHRSNVERARQDARAHQALLLLAIARRRSRAGRHLLQRWVETADPEMAMVARIGLAVFGDPQAVGALRDAAQAQGVGTRIEALLGQLTPPQEPESLHTVARGESAHCTACGKKADEVQHLMAGGQAVLCDQCVVIIGRRRAELRAPDDARCQICHRSAFEARGLYRYNGVEVCSHCLELSLGLLEREAVDAYLAGA
jgi:tetratricopeptide (TPR) repeat protein